MDSCICSEGIRFLAAPRERRAICVEGLTACRVARILTAALPALQQPVGHNHYRWMLPWHSSMLHDPNSRRGSHSLNTVKDVLKAGKVAVGAGAGLDVNTAALLAGGGFDFLL